MPIRVLLVEDSPVALKILQDILVAAPEVDVVGTARTGLEALEKVPVLQPQVICTDLHMPQMNGLVLTTEVMERWPTPILVLSIAVQSHDTQQVFQLLEAGAVDVLAKPVAGLRAQDPELNRALVNKIRILAGVKVFRRKRPVVIGRPVATKQPMVLSLEAERLPAKTAQTKTGQEEIRICSGESEATAAAKSVAEKAASIPTSSTPPPQPTTAVPTIPTDAVPQTAVSFPAPKPRIIGVGASTGGPQALQLLFSQLPRDFPPVVCVQHISEGFLPGLVSWLQQHCAAKLMIAQPGDRPTPGCIYFAPHQCHLTVSDRGQFSYLNAPAVDGHQPSITVTFSSLARFYGRRAAGVLLTGMGQDGAKGLAEMHQAGGFTLAQDQATSVVFGMPQVAIELGAVAQVLPIEAIAPRLLQLV